MCFVVFLFVVVLVVIFVMVEFFVGFYVGVEVGFDNYEIKVGGIDGVSGNGVVGGVYVGYDLLLGLSFFVGVEVNVSLSSVKLIVDDGIDVVCVKVCEIFGVSVCLGYMLNDSIVFYGCVGWVNIKFKVLFNGVLFGSDYDDVLVFGVGVEICVGVNILLCIEYVCVDYNDFVKNN